MSVYRIWLHWPGTYVRLSTAVLAVLIVALVIWRLRRPGLAMLAVLGWLASYEIAWETSQLLFGRSTLIETAWLVTAHAGWVLAAWLAGIRPTRWLAVTCVAAFAAWFAFGYRQTWPTTAINMPGEALNEASKTALGLAYLMGALRAPSDTLTGPHALRRVVAQGQDRLKELSRQALALRRWTV